MAGAGVGKSTLLSMMARNTRADVKVIALIGERGREVEDFVARTLPAEDRERTVVVAATSDAPALVGSAVLLSLRLLPSISAIRDKTFFC